MTSKVTGACGRRPAGTQAEETCVRPPAESRRRAVRDGVKSASSTKTSKTVTNAKKSSPNQAPPHQYRAASSTCERHTTCHLLRSACVTRHAARCILSTRRTSCTEPRTPQRHCTAGRHTCGLALSLSHPAMCICIYICMRVGKCMRALDWPERNASKHAGALPDPSKRNDAKPSAGCNDA